MCCTRLANKRLRAAPQPPPSWAASATRHNGEALLATPARAATDPCGTGVALPPPTADKRWAGGQPRSPTPGAGTGVLLLPLAATRKALLGETPRGVWPVGPALPALAPAAPPPGAATVLGALPALDDRGCACSLPGAALWRGVLLCAVLQAGWRAQLGLRPLLGVLTLLPRLARMPWRSPMASLRTASAFRSASALAAMRRASFTAPAALETPAC